MTMIHAPIATPLRREAFPFEVLAAVALALCGVALVWAAFDTRLIGGVPVWAKPAKFALSFVVHFATLAVIVRALSPKARATYGLRVAAMVMSAAFAMEMAYMILQAAQGQPSHFNVGTPFHAAMYAIMGVGAVSLVAMPVIVARIAQRDDASLLGPATRAGVWWGALASAALTLIVAGTMSAGGGPLVGVPPAGAATLPVFGWSAAVGDLRPAHFLALHALQGLPLAGLLLDRRGGSASNIPVLAAVWGVVTLAVFAQALLGLPLLRL